MDALLVRVRPVTNASINVIQGTYEEQVIIPQKNITLIGESRNTTKITWVTRL